MIIKPSRRDGFSAFSDYLNGKAENSEENEECKFIATGNSLGIASVNSWCIHANKLADTKRSGKRPMKKPIEHIIIRTRKGDILTPAMAKAKVPELLEALGYQNCPWVLVQHIKGGEPHYHLGVCRIDDNGKVQHPKSYNICREQADKFAKELGFRPAYEKKTAEKYAKKTAKLAGLWSDTKAMKPRERLKHFIKNGFIPARGNRGQLLFVDRDGKPHSPQRIPEAKEKGLRQKDMPGYFGLTADMVRTLPDCQAVAATLQRKSWKPTLQRVVRRIANEYAFTRYSRYHGNSIGRGFALPHLSSRHGVRLQAPDKYVPAPSHGGGFRGNAGMQSARGTRSASIDPTAFGRAQAAADAVSARFASAIDAIAQDPSLTPDQRAAAISALRQRQTLEASAARNKILDEAKQSAKARRRDYAALIR